MSTKLVNAKVTVKRKEGQLLYLVFILGGLLIGINIVNLLGIESRYIEQFREIFGCEVPRNKLERTFLSPRIEDRLAALGKDFYTAVEENRDAKEAQLKFRRALKTAKHFDFLFASTLKDLKSLKS